MTVLCANDKPTDIEIKDSGIPTFLMDCTGCGDREMIRPSSSHHLNGIQKEISRTYV
jgi:hypothetical protein